MDRTRPLVLLFLLLFGLSRFTQAANEVPGHNCGPGLEVVSYSLEVVSVSFDPTRGYLQDVVIVRADGTKTNFARSNRGIDTHFLAPRNPPAYPKHWYDGEDLKRPGTRVLDAATGGGKFVEDLRGRKIPADGFDQYVPDEMLNLPGRPFFRGDLAHIPVPDQTYTHVYLHHGPFEYMTDSPAFYQKSLEELRRVLKPGGVIRIIPVGKPAVLEEICRNFPGLEIVSRPDPDWKGYPYRELRRVEIP